MDRKRKMAIGAGGILLLAGIAAGALAEHRHGPMDADVNGDGQVTAQEIAATARARFAERDANKDGKLMGEEIPRPHHGRPGHREDGEARTGGGDEGTATPPLRQGAMDVDGDGAVSLREFYQSLRTRLLRADTNGDGALSAEELAAARERHHRRGPGHDDGRGDG